MRDHLQAKIAGASLRYLHVLVFLPPAADDLTLTATLISRVVLQLEAVGEEELALKRMNPWRDDEGWIV